LKFQIHGVLGLTKTGAIEYADQGIRVNAICPAMIKTPLSHKIFFKDEASAQRAISLHPAGRVENLKRFSHYIEREE